MIKISSSYVTDKLPAKKWRHLQARHEEEVSSRIDNYLSRRSHQHKDPVMDFLFEYYAFRPSHLKRWSPGFGRLLLKGQTQDWPFQEMTFTEGDAFLDIRAFPKDRLQAVRWILDMLKQTQSRPPHFGCFGMHEWAMVYKAKNVRHDYLSLRMDMNDLASFVESRPLVCTHFDAFRFFTDEAKPRNKFELSRQSFAANEQPGCLHTNMDLYKWAFKLYPWIPSEIIRRAFQVAVKTRLVDMKASPYDLRERGLEPIKIETEEGRREYLKKQQQLYEQAQPIRADLIEEYKQLLNALAG